MVLNFLNSLVGHLVPLYISNRPYKITKSRERGELDLGSLAREEKREGSWVFSQDEGIWYNTRRGGYRHRGQSETSQSEGVATAVINWSPHGKSFTDYHTHPLPIIAQDLVRTLQGSPEVTLSESIFHAKKTGNHEVLYWDQSLIPSVADIDSYIALLKENSECHFDFRIVSAFGRTDVNFLTRELNPWWVVNLYNFARMNVRAMIEESYKDGQLGYDGDIGRFIRDALASLTYGDMDQFLKVNIVAKV